MAQKTIGVTSNTQSKALRIPPLNQFIKFPCNLLDASNNILERIGIFIPASYRGTRNEHYTLSYFQPTRHMVPCITNATCNMSPIIPMYFLSCSNLCIMSKSSLKQVVSQSPFTTCLYQNQCHWQSWTIGQFQFNLSQQQQQYEWFQDLILLSIKQIYQILDLHLQGWQPHSQWSWSTIQAGVLKWFLLQWWFVNVAYTCSYEYPPQEFSDLFHPFPPNTW